MRHRHENPLLRYQMFGFTVNRWKRQPLLYGAVFGGVALVYLMVYQLLRYNEVGIGSSLGLALFFMCLAAPLMAYNLFSLEYERHTWESLALTRLTAKEILWGKWGAALARVAVLTLLFIPILLASYGASGSIFVPPSRTGQYDNYTFFAAIAVLFSWGALLVSLGMWLSFKLKRTLSTASALYAGQVFVLLLLPSLYSIFSYDYDYNFDLLMGINSYADGFAWWVVTLLHPRALLYLNPIYVSSGLGSMVDVETWRYADYQSRAIGLYYVGWGFAHSLIYQGLAALFAGFTYRGLKIAWRK